MALNPDISLAVKGIELQDPLAQYGKFAAIQSAQQQNQLAQMQMQEYERTRAEEEGARNYLARADLSKPDTRTELMRRYGKTGMALNTALGAQEQAALTQQETRGKIAKAEAETNASKFDLQNKTLNFVLQSIGNSSTPQDAIEHVNKGVQKGYISMAQGTAEIQQLQNMQPAEFAQYKVGHLVQTLGALDQLNQSKQTTQNTDRGNFIERQTYNAQGRPVGAPVRLPKTPSFSDVTAQGNLSLAQQKFAFERANPGITVQQTENGDLVGVNNRTGVAMPITMGGAAPAAAPVSNQFSPRVAPSTAPAVTPAIPGMRSVLDQTSPAAPMAAGVPAAPMAGTPLRGKETGLSESQGNAVAFGMRMKEANSILANLANQGTRRGANVQGVPFVGEALGDVLPSFLGGTSSEQQQVNQAKANFITAVLRKESGASIAPAEFDKEDRKYFPQFGDGENVIKQKENARNLAIEAMGYQAGPGVKRINEYQPSASSDNTVTDPTGTVHTFPTPQAAAAYKQAARIK